MFSIDSKFKTNKLRYFFQSSLAGLCIGVVLLFLNTISQSAIVASLGATTFILFTMPHHKIASSRKCIAGYIIGIIIGCLFHLFLDILPMNHVALPAIFGGFAVGLSIFIMVIIDVEHPPAAGIALGFVFSEWNMLAICAVMCGVITLAFIKRLFKAHLINLI